jgi:hypothetical protein
MVDFENRSERTFRYVLGWTAPDGIVMCQNEVAVDLKQGRPSVEHRKRRKPPFAGRHHLNLGCRALLALADESLELGGAHGAPERKSLQHVAAEFL